GGGLLARTGGLVRYVAAVVEIPLAGSRHQLAAELYACSTVGRIGVAGASTVVRQVVVLRAGVTISHRTEKAVGLALEQFTHVRCTRGAVVTAAEAGEVVDGPRSEERRVGKECSARCARSE